MLAGSFTSQPSARTSTPSFSSSADACRQRSFFRAQRTSFAPISAKPSAICRPSPMDPPVMIATRPERSNSFLTFTGESSTGLLQSLSIVVSIAVVGIKGPQILGGLEFYECRGRGHKDACGIGENIEEGAESIGAAVEIREIKWAPFPCVQPAEKRLYCANGFRRRKGAMAGPRHESLPQEWLVAFFANNLAVSPFV